MDTMNITFNEYLDLYRYYSLSSFFGNIFSGFLIDSFFGLNKSAITFSAGISISCFLVLLGFKLNNLSIMVLSRALLGLFVEPLVVTRTKFTTKYFSNTLIFGILFSFVRGGSVTLVNILGFIYDYLKPKGETYAMTIVFVTVAIMSFSMFILCIFLASLNTKLDATHTAGQEVDSDNISTVKALKTFSSSGWTAILMFALIYSSLDTFYSIATRFFQVYYNYKPKYARFLAGLPYTIAVFVCPLIGYFINKVKFHILWVLTAGTLMASSFLVMILKNLSFSAEVSMICMGLSYSIMAPTLNVVIAFLVPLKYHGNAFGLCYALLRLAQFLVTAIVQYFNFGYLQMLYLISILLFFLLILSLKLATGQGLNPI